MTIHLYVPYVEIYPEVNVVERHYYRDVDDECSSCDDIDVRFSKKSSYDDVLCFRFFRSMEALRMHFIKYIEKAKPSDPLRNFLMRTPIGVESYSIDLESHDFTGPKCALHEYKQCTKEMEDAKDKLNAASDVLSTYLETLKANNN